MTTEDLAQIHIFSTLQADELKPLVSHTQIHSYLQDEILIHEGDPLPARLYAVLKGTIRITRTAATGKETILRSLSTGEIFAAPALLGDGIAPATVIAETNCQILTVERTALLNAIRESPDIALRMLSVFNQRIQQMHDIVHGLVSERAIARLARYILRSASEHGTEKNAIGDHLNVKLSYYHIARSIGITYEECVRLFKQLQPTATYSRGGKITILDWDGLEAIASGN
ncbi:MAG TPA: Crp/Fnr family transcriptional regulator [Crinalium sp.]|jgi:CRP-like cAMP-binding protein